MGAPPPPPPPVKLNDLEERNVLAYQHSFMNPGEGVQVSHSYSRVGEKWSENDRHIVPNGGDEEEGRR